MGPGDKFLNMPDKGQPLEYTPGYTIFVYAGGHVRIDVPSGWHPTQTETSTDLRDQPEPDTCGMIQITVFPPFPVADFPGLPLRKMFRDMERNAKHEVLSRGPIEELKTRELQMLWQEQRYIDEDTGKIARATTHLARGGSRHVVVTCTCWDDGTEQFHPIFEVVRRSIRISDLGDALTGHRQRARDN